MRIRILMVLAGVTLLAGCSTTNPLTAAGQSVRFSDTKPAAQCQLLGNITGTQSNWLSGSGNEGSAMRGAANDLRNRAAEMGGNVIYGVTTPSQTFLSSFAPLDSKMQGQVYKCP
ncbi:DUF4156 domain-containing protein [Dickeya lacustris]|uniref:DUF4156 domain-containing protein n=1 Tax=Dickeya lacustris TaxID=2259638 RepID=A0ABY8G469_9GAMM|nr:DUF4156 domain-containing protein [Dickeya lacustris]WFN54744.1 DUF4156 domain-containing protein [Dickeya lacustris]